MRPVWTKFIARIRPFLHRVRELYLLLVDGTVRDAVETRRLFRFLLLSLAIFSLLFGIAFVSMIRSRAEVRLPNVVGKEVLQAARELQDLKVRIILDPIYTTEGQPYAVLSQKPDAGMAVKEGRAVTLRVSRGPKESRMPDLKGRNAAEARAAILDLFAGFEKVPFITETPVASDEAAGMVVQQVPAKGELVGVDSEINLAVSRGDSTSANVAQDWTLRNIKDVRSRLVDAGIEVRIEERESGSAKDVGRIFRQSVIPGSNLSRGDVVTFLVGTDKAKPGLDGEVLRVLRYRVPGTKGKNRELKISVTDHLGESSPVTKTLPAGSLLEWPYRTHGTGKVEIRIGDELVHRENF